MARVFISHAGADTCWAEQLHQWLEADRHEAFLDRHKDDGLLPGEEWEKRLYAELRRADAVVCVVTESYVKSVWCAAEIGAARALGTELLPLRFSSTVERHTLLKIFHDVDASKDPAEARNRLRLRLSVIDGGGGWGWPDDRSPYPGLRAFDLGEHRVFFGRAREITQIAERLRSPERASPAILTVVGPSGCGKSSLIRAGVLPRIAGQDDWLPLAPILPGVDPLGNLARAMAAVIRERHIRFDAASLRKDLLREGLKAAATDLLLAAGADSQCKLLIVIDQFEELLTQTEPNERKQFAATLQPALGGPVQVLATLRPEFLDPIAKDPDLSKLALRIRQVRPLQSDALRSVIEEPAKVAGLAIDDDLVAHLVADTGSGDALPLLAYTLEQLADGLTRGGTLSQQRYVDIGGVQGALQRQADAALDEACSSTGATRDQVMSALLSLVTIDEQGRPTKRTVALADLSGTAAQLEPFISRRLLSTEAAGERTLVAVSHEAFLANWPPLKDEIDAQATALRARRVVENAANDWVASGRDVSALLQGRQLAKATVDTGAELQPVDATDGSPAGARKRLGTLPWWPRPGRLVTLVNLNDTGREFLEASIRADRSRRRRQIMRVATAMVILAVIAVTAVAFYFQADAERARAQDRARQAIASGLENEAAAMLSRDRPGGDTRAMQELLAANALVPDSGELLDAVLQRLTTAKIADAGASVLNVMFNLDGQRLASAGGDTVRFWNAGSGRPLGPAVKLAIGGTDRLFGLGGSPTRGLAVASGGADNTVRLWNAETGQPIGAPLTGHTDVVTSVAFSPDGRRVATGSADNTVRLWNAETGQPAGDPLTGHNERVQTVAFSLDGHRLGQWRQRYDGAVVERRHRPARAGYDRPHRRGGQRGVQPRWASAGQRRRRRHGAAVERRHRPSSERPADRAHQLGANGRVQPRRASAGQRWRRRHGAAVERRHRPCSERPADRAHRLGANRGVQPRRASPGQRQRRQDGAAVEPGCGRTGENWAPRRSAGCVESRRASPGHRQPRRHGATVERRHRRTRRHPAYRPQRPGERRSVQPLRASSGHRRNRYHGAVVERRHRRTDRRPADRPHRAGGSCGVPS